MPSQDSTTPSPLKRPSINQRTSSTASLSSSQKHQHKVHRTHVVGHAHAHRAPHGRNPSYGKNLNKLNRLSSQSHIAHDGRNHQRKKSGPTGAEALSPKSTVQKNTSLVSLPKVASQASIKKNHSTASIARNTSAGQLKKQGLAPLTAKHKEKENSVGGFQLGDNSSSEEEAEWEDSSASPNTTRKNSTAEGIKHEQEASQVLEKRHSSPPAPSLKAQHKSAPSLARKVSATPSRPPEDAPNFLRDSRSTRAPPAMSSIAAVARPPSRTNLRGGLGATESTGQSNGASSMENGVSRFVNGSVGANGTPRTPDVVSDDDDYDSPSSFLPHYHPQAPAISPHGPSRSSSGQFNRRANPAGLPSRTQQRLELQRRETMRSSPTPPENDPMDGPLAIRTRSASRGRNRASQDTVKAARKDYESANAQLEVIKRYRNPMVEALYRLQDMDVIPRQDDKASFGGKSRPVSRAGSRRQSMAKAQLNTTGKQVQDSSQNTRPTNGHRRISSRGRVRFERQGSHEEIGLSRSQGQDDTDEAEAGDGLDDAANAEEALLRRTWESREVYEA